MASTATEIERPHTPLKSSRAESARWVPLAFAAVYILWGSTFLGIRIAIESFPPLAMAAIRHSLVGLILYPILRIKTGIRPTAGNWWTAAVTGVSLLCISNGGLSWAEQKVPSGIAALLVATISLWLVILDWLKAARYSPGAARICGPCVGFRGDGAAGWSGESGRVAANRFGGDGRAGDCVVCMGMRVVVFETAGYAGVTAASGGDAKPGGWCGAVDCGDSFGGSSRAAFCGDFGTFVDGADLPGGVWVGDWVYGLPVHT